MRTEMTESPANDRILSEMLALQFQKERKQRYPSAEELVEELG